MTTDNKFTRKFQRYLSVPALDELDKTNGDNGVEFRNLRKDRSNRKRFTVSAWSLRRLSTNETSDLAPSTPTLSKTSLSSSFLPLPNSKLCYSSCSIDKSARYDVPRLKGKSSSMTQAYSLSRGPADPDESAGAPLTTKNIDNAEIVHASCSSKARQKKFHRHFKQVDVEEKVLNYYSCALVGDILLQGHLYITENFFAFYSNVFGYVTKLLIPAVDVLKISKEKTAKIIPNAVGISTEDEKHVFGSLLSRDSTYKFMVQVWKAAISSNPTVNITPPTETIKPEHSDEDSTVSSGNEGPSSFISNITAGPSTDNFQKLLPSLKRKSLLNEENKEPSQDGTWYKFRTILIVIVALLAFLFASAGYLLYRIVSIQNNFKDLTFSGKSDIYEEILKWQSTLHTTSANKIHEFLDVNLNQIIKIRLSLEALSTLMSPKKNKSIKSTPHSVWEELNSKEKK